MTYVIVDNGVVSNLIEANQEVANKLGAVPFYDGLAIGKKYAPPRMPTNLETAEQEITGQDLRCIEMGQCVTDLELNVIAQGQYLTDLELMLLEGK